MAAPKKRRLKTPPWKPLTRKDLDTIRLDVNGSWGRQSRLYPTVIKLLNEIDQYRLALAMQEEP